MPEDIMTCRKVTFNEWKSFPKPKPQGFPSPDQCTCCDGGQQCGGTCTGTWYASRNPSSIITVRQQCLAAGGSFRSLEGGASLFCDFEAVEPAGGCSSLPIPALAWEEDPNNPWQIPPAWSPGGWAELQSPTTCCDGICAKTNWSERYKIAVNGLTRDENLGPTILVKPLPCNGSFTYLVSVNASNCTMAVLADARTMGATVCKTVVFYYNLTFDNQGNPNGATLTGSNDSGVMNCGSEEWSGCPTTAEILSEVDFSPPTITLVQRI